MSAALGGADYLTYVVPGVALMQAITGMSAMVVRTVTERRWGLAAFKLQSGVPASAYLLSLQIPGIVTMLVRTVVVLVMGVALGAQVSASVAGLALLSGLVAAIFWDCVGFCLTAVVTSYQTRDFLLSVVILPVSFAAPVFYGLEGLPAALRVMARVNPLTYQVEWARGTEVLLSAGVSVAAALGVGALAMGIVGKMRELSFEA